MKLGLAIATPALAWRAQGATAFTPASLFAANEQGVWYDPSDMSTLYQDAAGTTPVTGLEQPVGLMLDKSKGRYGSAGYYSGSFDGTGDYLRTNLNGINIRTDAFTFEGFARLSTTSACALFSCSTTAGAAGSDLYFNESGGTFFLGDGVTNTLSFAASSFPTNAWAHFAITFDGTTYRAFINGTSVASSTTLLKNATVNGIDIFARLAGVTLYGTGSLSNFRVVKGTALYTANFTAPSAPLTAVSGTSLLTCQSATFVDNSSNGYTVTANGNAAVGANNPFGNHASQSTAASRPVLSARYNLLTHTEAFDNAFWTEQNIATIAAGSTTAPDGTTSAETITASAGAGAHGFYNTSALTTVSSLSYTISVAVKKNTARYVYLKFQGTVTSPYIAAVFDLDGSGSSATQTATAASGSITSTSQVSLGDGWFRLTIIGSIPQPSTYVAFGFAGAATGNTFDTTGNVTFTAAGTESVYIWGADLRVSNDGVGIPSYQRVGAATSGSSTASGTADYDSTGFPVYLRADGTDDRLATSAIDFSGTDKVTVIAGVRKLSDAARGTVVELTATAALNNGAFHLTAPNAASATYAFESKGTALTDAVASSGVAAPITSVLTGIGNIAGDSAILRVNGVQADADTGDQGTGNYANAILYVGSRGGSTLPFNGRYYGLIVRGAASSAAEITSAEAWMATKAGVTL